VKGAARLRERKRSHSQLPLMIFELGASVHGKHNWSKVEKSGKIQRAWEVVYRFPFGQDVIFD
jgi:hypothetical protein